MLIRFCLLAALLAPCAPVAARAQNDDASRAAAVMQDHVRALHDRLRITEAEQPQWDAVAAAMMANARHVAELHAAQVDALPSAPAELRHYAAVTQAHAEDAQRLIAPFDQLYAVMSPEQRATADATFHRFEQERLRKAGL